MATQSRLLTDPLPKGWSKHIRSGVLHTLSLAATAMESAWARASGRRSVHRLRAEIDRLRAEIVYLEEEMAIKDYRWRRHSPRRRPHYGPVHRMRILRLRAARGWTVAQVAERFLLTEMTIQNWMKRLDEKGEAALVRLEEPVNKYPDFVACLVRHLKVLSPALGKARIANMLARAGLHLGATTVGRMLKRNQTSDDLEAVASVAPTGRPLRAKRPNQVWHVDLTAIPTSAGSVAVHKGRVVVSAPSKSTAGGVGEGRVYVFEQSGSVWTKVADVEPTTPLGNSRFGTALDLTDNSIIVGAKNWDNSKGAAFIFELDGQAWSQELQFFGGSSFGLDMGAAVAINETHALVGAPRIINDASFGFAWVFVRVSAGWQLVSQLIPEDGLPGDRFGTSISLVGKRALVGSPAHSPSGVLGAGSAYLFENEFGFFWDQREKFTATDAYITDALGTAVSMTGDSVLAGAPGDSDAGSLSGSVYLWSMSGSFCPPLYSAPPAISLANGGFQVFSVNGGQANAGKLYWILGSASGTSPGLSGGGFTLPLNLDTYLLFTFQFPNTLIQGSLGFLDWQGEAQAQFLIPPGQDPSLVGTNLDHGYAVLDVPGSGQTLMVSNAVPLSLVQ